MTNFSLPFDLFFGGGSEFEFHMARLRQSERKLEAAEKRMHEAHRRAKRMCLTRSGRAILDHLALSADQDYQRQDAEHTKIYEEFKAAFMKGHDLVQKQEAEQAMKEALKTVKKPSTKKARSSRARR